jgi:4-amino-4-deoxy-L-arabinose transferase-like glycosyltransferase
MRTRLPEWHARRAALVVLAVAAGARLALAALVPLAPDETYYWEWSRRLAAGYLDHPPAIAYFVRLGTVLFGATPVGVRVGSVAAGTVAALAIVLLAGALGGDRAMLRAALLTACIPLAQVGLVLATPDAPLLMFWALALLALALAVRARPRTRESLARWALAGAALGGALASKYTAVLLPVGVAIAMLARPSLRRWLAEPGPYVAAAIALGVLAPNLLWNAHHDWATVGYQLAHGLAVHRGSALAHEGALLSGQVALVSPLLFLLLAAATVRALAHARGPVPPLLSIITLATWFVFCASALRSAVEPNWQAPAYHSAIVLAAVHEGGSRWRTLFRAGIALGAAITLLICAQSLRPFLPITSSVDPTARVAGWGELAARVDAARAAAPAGVITWVAGERYQEASELAFLLPDHPQTFTIDVADARATQYDLWPRFHERAHAGDRLVLVLGLFTTAAADPVIARLAPHFQRVTLRETVALHRGAEVRAWRRVWVLDGWRGSWPSDQLPERASLPLIHRNP